MRGLFVALALAACGGGEPQATVAGPGAPIQRLVTEAEVARYEAALMQQLAANAARHCERPVLRGTPTPGPATELAAFVAPTGALATCLERSRELVPQLQEATPAAFEHARACGELYANVVRAAVAHSDACSPFQFGVRNNPILLQYIHAPRVIGLYARELADHGRRDAALALIADTLRFSQDLMRGHTSLIVQMIATAAENQLLDDAYVILTVPPPDHLDELAADLDRLLATEPGFDGALRAETEYLAMYYGLGPLKPDGWTPPGGWPDDIGAPPRARRLADGVDPRDGAAIMLVAADASARGYAMMCPDGAALAFCHAQLAATPKVQLADTAEIYQRLATHALDGVDLRDPHAVETTRLRVRDGIANAIRDSMPHFMADYAAKRAVATSRLVALRLHVEVLRAGRCPSVAELFAPPWATLRAPAILGDAVTVSPVDGGLAVDAPAWANSDKPAWRIPCSARTAARDRGPVEMREARR